MKVIASALVALSLIAGLTASAHATFNGAKNSKAIFKQIERNSP